MGRDQGSGSTYTKTIEEFYLLDVCSRNDSEMNKPSGSEFIDYFHKNTQKNQMSET